MSRSFPGTELREENSRQRRYHVQKHKGVQEHENMSCLCFKIFIYVPI